MKNLTAIHAIKNNHLIEKEKTTFNLPYDTIICRNCDSTINYNTIRCWYCGGYISHCWYCGHQINSKKDIVCDKCYQIEKRHYICPECGKCHCDNPEYKEEDRGCNKCNKHHRCPDCERNIKVLKGAIRK